MKFMNRGGPLNEQEYKTNFVPGSFANFFFGDCKSNESQGLIRITPLHELSIINTSMILELKTVQIPMIYVLLVSYGLRITLSFGTY